MKIVNVIPETYQEFDDHLSIVLFSFGCNLRCSYCYNYDFVADPANILPESAEQIIDKYFHPLIDGLVLLGGEPTIYPLGDIKRVCCYAKETYNLDIKLFTNGTNPITVIRGLREGWLDFVSIDFKTVTDTSIFIQGDNPAHKLEFLFERLAYFKLLEKIEVRTTLYDRYCESDLSYIKSFCEERRITHLVQQEAHPEK
jgi:pyruvate formate lyase activating enzyme